MKKYLVQFTLCGLSFIAGAFAASLYFIDKLAEEPEKTNADSIGDGSDINDDFIPEEIDEN